MSEDQLAALRKENEDLRDKLRRLVPEWKNLKLQNQKLKASEAAAVARAEQLVKDTSVSPSSSVTPMSEDVVSLRAKLKQLIPEWKRLKEVNKSLAESESRAVEIAKSLEYDLNAANAELEVLRSLVAGKSSDQKQDESLVQDLETELNEARLKIADLESRLSSANGEIQHLREVVFDAQEQISRDSSSKLEMEERFQQSTLQIEKLQSHLDETIRESEELRNTNQELTSLQVKFGAVNSELEHVSLQAQISEQKLQSAYLQLEQTLTALNRVQELEIQLQEAYTEVEIQKKINEDNLKRAELSESLQERLNQQELELIATRKRLENLRQRPTKLELQKIKHENSSLQKKLSAELEVVRALQNDLAQMRLSKETISSLSNELDDLQTRFSVCQESRDSLIIDGDKLEAENRTLRLQIDELVQNCPSDFNDLKEFFKDSLSAEKSLSSVIQEEFAALNDRLFSALTEVAALKSELGEKKLELESACAIERQLTERLQNLTSTMPENENEHSSTATNFEQFSPSGNLGREPLDSSPDKSDTGVFELFNDALNVSDDGLSEPDKFHNYQNRIESLEEEVLELSARNSHLTHKLSHIHSELESCQEVLQLSSSDARHETYLLLQLISDKDELIENLSTQLNDMRIRYGEKVRALKAILNGLRNHNDGLQKIIHQHNKSFESQKRYIRQGAYDASPHAQQSWRFHDSESPKTSMEMEIADSSPAVPNVELKEALGEIEELRRQLEQFHNVQSSDSNLLVNTITSHATESGESDVNEPGISVVESSREIEELRRQLEIYQLRWDEQSIELRNTQVRLDELTVHNDIQKQGFEESITRIQELLREAEGRQKQIGQLDVELREARARIAEQDMQLKAAHAKWNDQRLELGALLSRLEDENQVLGNAQKRFDDQALELQSSQSEVNKLLSELEEARSEFQQQKFELEAAQNQLEELRFQLDDAQQQLKNNAAELQASQNRIERLRQVGEAIVVNYNELRGHYELLNAKVESEAAIIEHITRSHTSKSLSPKMLTSSPISEPTLTQPATTVRSASVPARKRRTLKQFILKLFERTIYDENGKPISRVDLTEDTTFVWDPVKKKYIDLNAPEVEEKPISKPPPRPSFTPGPGSLKAGAGPALRKPNRSLTGSRYALPDGISEATLSQSSIGEKSANPTPITQSRPTLGVPSNSSRSNIYRPPTINSFDEAVVVTSDYHSLVASLLTLQKELSCIKRSKLETDLYVSTLVKQIKEKLVKAPVDPVTSDSIELSKLICCLLLMAGVVSAMTQVTS